MSAKGNELTIYDPGDYAVMRIDAQTLAEALADNLGGARLNVFELDRVTVPAGKSTTWMVPTLDGTEDSRTIDGVIIYWRDGRSFWRVPFDESGGGSPPDCFSLNGINGIGDPGGACISCPFGQFGGACRETRQLFVMRPTDLLPIVVSVPRSSLKSLRRYFLALASKNLPHHGVVTRLTLVTAQSSSGIPYPQIAPQKIGDLNSEQRARMALLRDQLRPAIEGETTPVDPDAAFRARLGAD